MAKTRLDVLLHRRGLAPSREKAKRLILAGEVLVAGQTVDKVATQVEDSAAITVRERPPYVSRGGIKLAAALDAFDIDLAGRIVADVGASTGGFTDCLLQRGSKRVFAIDVGYGQLAWSLRTDDRVHVMERTNARHLAALPETVDLVTVDVSFISLRLILPQVQKWLSDAGQVVMLIKPQFEAGRNHVGRGGIVRNTSTHRAVLEGVLEWGIRNGWVLCGLVPSPIKGAKGNVEFFAWLSLDRSAVSVDPHAAIELALGHCH